MTTQGTMGDGYQISVRDIIGDDQTVVARELLKRFADRFQDSIILNFSEENQHRLIISAVHIIAEEDIVQLDTHVDDVIDQILAVIDILHYCSPTLFGLSGEI